MMNNKIGCAVLLCTIPLLVLTSFSLPAKAQNFDLAVTVPFAFTAGSKTLPAGEYRLRPLAPTVIDVRAADNPGIRSTVGTFYAGGAGYPPKPTQLIFRRSGNVYYLYQVWRGGMSMGYQVLAPKHLQRALYQAAAPRDEVVIYAKR